MSISRYNSEGYLDPTAYEALTHVERKPKYMMTFRPLVFICSPFAGDVERNRGRARVYCRFAVTQNRIPFAPHLLFPQFMDDNNPEERELAIFFGLVFMGKCRELWVFGDNITKGMSVEIEKAKTRKIPIRHFNETCKEVSV